VKAGSMQASALVTRDYVYDILPEKQ
jgi:hypothetical protein